jgi:hypothetical protein
LSNWGEATDGCETKVELIEFNGISRCIITPKRNGRKFSSSKDSLKKWIGFIAVRKRGETSHSKKRVRVRENVTPPPKVEV